MVPHDKDKDNPSELIRGKDVAAFGLWSLPSFDEPRDEPAVAAPQIARVAGFKAAELLQFSEAEKADVDLKALFG